MTQTKAYWMLADTELPISRDKALQSSFEAHFKHGLLFNEKLMISDAQAVNCVNFRELVRSSDQFKELLSPNLLAIAVRNPNNNLNPQRLTQVRDAFLKENKQHMSNDEFLINSDLDLINEKTEVVPYTYSALRENYTSNVLKLFSSSTASKIFGEDNKSLLFERLQKESERDNGLGRVFLHKNIQADLASIGRHEVWEKQKSNIIRLSDVPYVTGIPQVLDSNPIYSPLHRESFNLANPIKTNTIQKGKVIDLGTNLDLSSYERALSLLKSDDILFLRDSYEFKQFQKFVHRGVSSDQQLDNAQDALIAYQTLVDQYIIDRHLGRATSKQFAGKRFIEPIRKVSQEGGVFALGLAITDSLSSGALALTNFFASEYLGNRSHSQLAEQERTKRKLLTELESSDEAKIKAKQTFVSNDKSETIYSSVKG